VTDCVCPMRDVIAMPAKRILCDAAAFGYGPVGKLLTILTRLSQRHQVTVLASHTTLVLASKSSLGGLKVCDTEDVSALNAASRDFDDADLFINVMNPISAEFAQRKGVPIAVVDSLFWMWESLPEALSQADLYIIQGFPKIASQLGRFAIKNSLVVGAIVDDNIAGVERANQLLVNFGGLRSKLVDAEVRSLYVLRAVEALNEALAGHRFDRIVIVGDPEGIGEAAKHVRIERAEVKLLGHNEFLYELDRSVGLISSPGLTTTYEAFTHGTPVAFLPPQNWSQYLILLALRDAAAAPWSLHWTDCYPDVAVSDIMPEALGVQHVAACIKRFGRDRKAQQLLVDTLRKSIRGVATSPEVVTSTQGAFVSRFGTHGADEAATAIESLLR
jgi:hydroxymethylcytosylglucuronate/cytosylglucuronate synthase